jgi:hypothetical protein
VDGDFEGSAYIVLLVRKLFNAHGRIPFERGTRSARNAVYPDMGMRVHFPRDNIIDDEMP